MKDYSQLSVKEWDRKVDSGEIVAWTTAEARRVSSELAKARNTPSTGRQSARTNDKTGELADACRKIMAYKLKTKAPRKPQVGGRGVGQTWHA
jgi:hypothetical protein